MSAKLQEKFMPVNRRSVLRGYAFLLLVIVLAFFGYRVLELSFRHAFDPDEFEHVQDAWLMSQGLSIYRDFFEHHPPLLYFWLSPLLGFFNETGKLLAARAAMVPFAAGILAMSYLLAARVRGRLAGAMACALLSTVLVFQRKSIEVRPDVPATFLLLLAVYLASLPNRGRLGLAAAGGAFGAALLCTPKLIFASPAFVLVMVVAGQGRVWNWRAGGWMLSGFLLPFGMVAAYLCLHGSLRQAIYFNVNFNLAVPFAYRGSSLRQTLGDSLADNWFFWLLALPAVAASTARAIRKLKMRGARWRNESLITMASLGLAIGLFVIQVPLRQYLMSLCAMLSILAGIWASRGFYRLMGHFQSTTPCVLMAAVSGVLVLHPTPALLRDRLASNTEQLRALRYVWEVVPPNQTMFDCWTGFTVFRRPVFYFHFLGLDIIGALERLDPSVLRDSLVIRLQKKRPWAIIPDPMLQFLPKTVLRYITINYHIDSKGILLLRNVPAEEQHKSP